MIRRAPLVAVLALAGCTVGPDYAKPEVATPPAYARPVTADAAAGAVDLAHWWTAYRDPELDRLVGIALAENLDVRTAISRLRQARWGEVSARAQFLPQINANAATNYTRFSKNAGLSSLAGLFGGGGATGGNAGSAGGGMADGGVAAPGDDILTYSLGFDASWEIDLFGGGRRGVEGAAARTAAAELRVGDTQVSLVAEVADGYLQYRTLQAREAVTRAEIARQRRALELRAHVAQVGLVPQGDYIRERANLATTEAGLEPLLVEQAIQVHALGLLLGRPPEALIAELAAPAALPAAPPVVPPGLPSELLRRRPDIRAAERNLAAATADIGVAVADLYPRFSLTGMAQLISTALSNLFERDSLQVTGSARAMFPILDFGRRQATVNVRREQREQAYLDYQRTVLAALKDVEDALARIEAERRRGAVLRSGYADSERSLRAVEARYRSGLVDLSAVLQAQQSLLAARDALALSDGNLRRDTAALYKALGGGWSVDGD